MDCFDNEGTTMRPSKRRAQKQHATLTRRLRTVMATTASHGDGTATSHGDDDGDVAGWRRRRRVTTTGLRTVTATETLHGDSDCWEAGKRERQRNEWTMFWKRKTVLRKGNERKKWEMETYYAGYEV